ncbi:MAG: hypothetical protein FP826_00775, partial [Sphingomonadales bacterium]|nr:hypothetical protein [Sphingomonadales bacterium]MBU3992745.1 hypothetical protein [Alphaproteobacteria bacterium]
APAPAPAPPPHPMRTGVTTHFSQGWPPRLLPAAAALGTVTIRDSLHWAAAEAAPGRIAFTEANSGHITRACAMGMTVLLGLEPRNPSYDGGMTAWSPRARSAFARYVLAIADRWPNCVVAIEIGNEINGRGNVTGPAAQDRIASHVALLKAVHAAVKPRHPGLVLLGGSTNTIATGFLTRLIRAGALDHVDGLAVHPYREQPEGTAWEIARLRAAMARAGAVKPIWATEFSREFPDPAAAAPWYLKMIALLEGAGVADHFWYALADQSFFPTMGLLTRDGTPKPAAAAYRFATRTLAPRGAAQRIDHGDPALFHFRFGADAHVIWGARRSLAVSGPADAFAADGSPLALPAEVSDTPVVITGSGAVSFGPAQVLADSFYGFARAPLAWFAQAPRGSLTPLTPTDWQWTSYLGEPALPLMQVNRAGLGTMPGAGTLLRYTARSTETLVASVCLRPKGKPARTPATAMLARNGAPLWRGTTGTGPALGSATIAVRPGDTLDFVLPPRPGASLRLNYRFRVSRTAADTARC